MNIHRIFVVVTGYKSVYSDFISSERRTFLKYGKVRWPGFREFTNLCLRQLSNSSDARVKEMIFREI